ncbi:glucuronoxylan 4-O-methyltransferase 1-like [Chenopodium quinoa]|uniref:glucuronoxylan 4-O-methyltransferase 1-like n=1 Tax=Chenopodium quinoa TaxID=63459 RepID=UPI000B78DFC5|nr:glucuronoxylan 4-O-methyltransferase 1-like [Chenopodium quinoa]
MPPETSSACHTPQICPPVLPRSTVNSSDSTKRRQLKRMEITLTSFLKTCNLSESSCKEATSHTRASTLPPNRNPITKKEYRFLSDIITQRAPCNLLIFGWEPQYRRLAKINSAGTTVILEDTPEKVRVRRSNSTRIYKVSYDVKAKEAYRLLKHARDGAACAPNSGPIETSSCKLALTNLPNEVYRSIWDVILIDGPGSDRPEAPGRMTAIYTSSTIARAGNITTNVVLHDVDRMIEKWFSREFLCEENLDSSKGRYWNFKIKGGQQWHSTSFCS